MTRRIVSIGGITSRLGAAGMLGVALGACRTSGDQIGERRRELAERLGCPSPAELGFSLEGEPGYRACMPIEPSERCGGCDDCLLLQATHWLEQVPL